MPRTYEKLTAFSRGILVHLLAKEKLVENSVLAQSNYCLLSRREFEKLKILFWRLATLAFRLPSPQLGLTTVFGMRTGVTPAMNHQNIIFKPKELRPTGTSIFLSGLPLRKTGRSLKTKSDTIKRKPRHTIKVCRVRHTLCVCRTLTRLSQFLSRVLSTY